MKRFPVSRLKMLSCRCRGRTGGVVFSLFLTLCLVLSPLFLFCAPVHAEDIDSDAERTQESASAEGSDDIYEEAADSHRILPDGEKPDDSLRVGEDGDKPFWYPRDTEVFPFYHDEEAPRVIDRADIFTEEEEARMEARLQELRPQLEKDIVVFTDDSTYGLTQTAYADDFFDYNGYGYGDDFEGVCLMICMDPGDRGWWTSCHGPLTMGLYTETAANQIDDLLYTYMADGSYGEGVADWIENMRRLYTTGSPYSEEWALQSPDGFARFHDADAPRVVDDAGLLTGEEREKLTARALSVSEKYGLDVVIHTVRNEGILDREDYGSLYYLFHGYGFGEDYDGIQLTIFKRPEYSGGVTVSASGKGLEKLTDVNRKRLENRCENLVLERNYYEAADQWLRQTGHMLRTGRAPRSAASWGFTLGFEALIGLLFGGISLGRAKARMATPTITTHADNYVVPGSVRISKVEDRLVNTTAHRHYSPVKTRSSSGGGSSGRSSYSGSHSSSSGRTHSGSGRKF